VFQRFGLHLGFDVECIHLPPPDLPKLIWTVKVDLTDQRDKVLLIRAFLDGIFANWPEEFAPAKIGFFLASGDDQHPVTLREEFDGKWLTTSLIHGCICFDTSKDQDAVLRCVQSIGGGLRSGAISDKVVILADRSNGDDSYVLEYYAFDPTFSDYVAQHIPALKPQLADHVHCTLSNESYFPGADTEWVLFGINDNKE